MENKNDIDMIDVIRGFAELNSEKEVHADYFIQALIDGSETPESDIVEEFFKICKATRVVPMEVMFAKLKDSGLLEGLDLKEDKKMIEFLSTDDTLVDLEALGKVKKGADGKSLSVNIDMKHISHVKRITFKDWGKKIDNIDDNVLSEFEKGNSEGQYFNDDTVFSLVEYMCGFMSDVPIQYNVFLKSLEITAKEQKSNINPAEEIDDMCYHVGAIPMFNLVAKLSHENMLTEEGKKEFINDPSQYDALVDIDSISNNKEYTNFGEYQHAIGMNIDSYKLVHDLKVMTFGDVFERAKKTLTPDGKFK